MDRRDFLTIAVTAPLAAAACASVARDFSFDFELDEATIPSLQAGMQSGKRTARSITQLYLDRIRQLNRSGPVLNAIIEVNPEALKIAETLDAERRMGRTRGPMHGIPVLLKDNISTLAPLTTTAGSLALQGCIPPHEAVLARRLREAGAIILGKANMSEWATAIKTGTVDLVLSLLEQGWEPKVRIKDPIQTLKSISRDQTLQWHVTLEDGSIVFTTAEIVIGDLSQLAFSRENDPTTGYRELVVRKR